MKKWFKQKAADLELEDITQCAMLNPCFVMFGVCVQSLVLLLSLTRLTEMIRTQSTTPSESECSVNDRQATCVRSCPAC